MSWQLRSPLALVGLACVAGAWLYPHWQPGPLGCAVGVLLCGALGLRSRLALVAAAFWLGCLAPASRVEGPALRGPSAVSGRVELAWGRRALLALPQGGRLLLSSPQPLQSGQVVHAFGSGKPVWTSALPGEPDPELFARTARVRAVLAASTVQAPPREHRLGLAEHSGLLEALVTGDRSGVSEPQVELLRATGTSHVLAVSGLHVGLLAGLGALLFGRGLRLFSPWWEAPPWLVVVLGTGLVVAFSSSVGWPVSTRRAAVMASGALLAAALARRLRPWNLLGLAALLSVVAEPLSVRTLSFQLSFGAVAGILSLPPVSGWLPNSLRATLGASLGTLPALAWSLQSLALVSPLANLIAVPAVALMLPCSLLAWHTGWVAPLALADSTAACMLWALERLPSPELHPAVGPLGAAGLALAVVWPRGRGALLLLALTLRSYPARPVVTFLSVGQGDAALVEGPQTLLIDGGPPGEGLLHYLRRRGLHHLDVVVLSHAHPDHSGGLEPVLRELRVDELRLPRLPAPGEDRTLYELAIRQGARVRVGGGLHPSADFLSDHAMDLNESSLVLLQPVGGLRVLFTGDIEGAGEAARDWPQADVLKVPHHGSRSSSSPDFLEQVQPSLAVIGCGRENRYGHPHPEVLRRYPQVLRTDQQGSIEVSEAGVRAWAPGRGWREL